jgi:hypothetical protein
MSRLDRFKASNLSPADDKVVNFPSSKKHGKENAFAQISLQVAAEVSKKMKNADHVILAMLIYKAFRARSQIFTLSNDLPTVYGVGRKAKSRALTRFEEAGVIRVERHGRQAPIVTLLVRLD